MADAAVLDARAGLTGRMISTLRQAERITFTAITVMDTERALLISWTRRIDRPGNQKPERHSMEIKQIGLRPEGKAALTGLDLKDSRQARSWKRFAGLLRVGDVLILEYHGNQGVRLRLGESGRLHVSLYLGSQRRPKARAAVEGQARVASGEPGHPTGGSFDRFTERARKVLQLAQEESQRLNHNYIGTEHLLLGLVREGEGVAAKVLANLGVELNKVRSEVEFIIGRGDRAVTGEIGLTPRAKKVIELSVDEARRLNHHYIGTEHLLLGLVREGEGIAAGVLESLGVLLDKVRAQVIDVLNQSATYGSGPRSSSRSRGRSRLRRVLQRVELEGTRFDRFSEAVRKAFKTAMESSARYRHEGVSVEHLFLALIAERASPCAQALTDVGLDRTRVVRLVRARLRRSPSIPPDERGLTEGAKRAIEATVEEFRRLPSEKIGVEHLLLGLLRTDDGQRLIASLGADIEVLRSAVERRLDLPEQG